MNTRKSSPLPNPNDTIARYQISYRTHYQNLHRHLLARIYKEEALKNRIVKDFVHLAKQYDKLKEKSSKHKINKSVEQNEVNLKMSSLYSSICEKELEISKLYEESEGILFQLCDMLKSTEEDMRKIRQSNDTNHTKIRFLHHESLYHHGEEIEFGKSIDHDITASSEFGEDKPREIRFNESNEKILTEPDLTSSFQKILKERLNRSRQIQESKEKISTKESEIQQPQESDANELSIWQENKRLEPNLSPIDDDGKQELFAKEEKETIDTLVKEEANPDPQIQRQQTESSTLSKILNNYQKPQIKHEIKKKISKINFENEIIEINSSVEDCLGEKRASTDLKISKNLPNHQQKSIKKQNKNFKSCITILD